MASDLAGDPQHSAARSSPITCLTLPLQIFSGSAQATLQYAGLAPSLVGVYQSRGGAEHRPQRRGAGEVHSGGVNGAQTLYTSVGN